MGNNKNAESCASALSVKMTDEGQRERKREREQKEKE